MKAADQTHVKTCQEGNPLYLSQQSRDIPFRRVDPSRAPSAPEEWSDSALLWSGVCVCVCQTYYCWVPLLPLLVIDDKTLLWWCDGDMIALYIYILCIALTYPSASNSSSLWDALCVACVCCALVHFDLTTINDPPEVFWFCFRTQILHWTSSVQSIY